MSVAARSAQDTLQELHEWSQVARGFYESAGQRHDSPGVRALKLYLAERHTEHLRELRHCLHDIGGMGPSGARPAARSLPGLGNEIQRSLVSPHRPTVILACGAVEKQVALAYEHALSETAPLETLVRATLARHVAELESSQKFVEQIQQESDRLGQNAAAAPVVASTAASASTPWWRLR